VQAPLVLTILCAIIIGQAATLVLGTFYLSLLALGGLLFKPVAGLVLGNFVFRYLQKEKQTVLLWKLSPEEMGVKNGFNDQMVSAFLVSNKNGAENNLY
jgi:hypothetical protein